MLIMDTLVIDNSHLSARIIIFPPLGDETCAVSTGNKMIILGNLTPANIFMGNHEQRSQ